MATFINLLTQPPDSGSYWQHPSAVNLDGNAHFPSVETGDLQQLDYQYTVSVVPAPVQPGKQYPGSCVPAYKEYYYNQVYVIPSIVNRGRLLSDYDESVEVWNAYIDETRTLNSIDYPPVEETGTDISGVTGVIPPPPDDYLPLISKVFNLHIDFEGPPAADALFEFVFDSETPTLLVTGQRLVVFGFIPQSEYVERFLWLTDLLPSFDGKEQYVKVRPVPRRELSYRYIASDPIQRGRIFNIISSGMAFDFGVPIWQQGQHPTVGPGAGAYEILCDTSESEFEAGKGFFIWQSDLSKESGVVDEVLADRITLVSPLENAYGHESYVMPLLICKMPKSVQSNLSVMNATDIPITFRAVESTDLTPASLPDSYKGLDVLHDCPEVSGTVAWSHTGNWEDLDKITGTFENDYAQQYAKTTRGFQKTFISNSEMWTFRQWLYKMAGRVGMFWVPSYTGKIVLAGTVPDASLVVDIINADLVLPYRNTPFVTDIEFEFTNGDIRRHDVSLVERLDPDTERLTLIQVTDREFTMDDIRQISLLHRVRLDADTIEFKWDQAADCTVSFNTREVVQ